jgi:hypothetical protein
MDAMVGDHLRRQKILSRSVGDRLAEEEAGVVCLDRQVEVARRGQRVEGGLWE